MFEYIARVSAWFGFGVLFFAMKFRSAAFLYINEAGKSKNSRTKIYFSNRHSYQRTLFTHATNLFSGFFSTLPSTNQ